MNLLVALVLTALPWPAGAPPDSLLLEAENAELLGVVVATDRAGYSGTGYVTGFDQPGDSLRFQVEVAETGVYALRLSVAQTTRIQMITVRVDGVSATASVTNTGGVFAERALGEFRLTEGTHTVVVRGNFDVDYLRLAPITYPPPAKPTQPLSDSLATSATRALHAFLIDEYGRHILSGQQDVYGNTPRLSEIPYVESVTGRRPAIGSFDLIDFSPTRAQCGTRTAGWAEHWITNWAQADASGKEGIVNLMWHWNAPTDLYDTDCNGPDEQGTNPSRNWYSGFYTDATSFNFAAALAEGPGGANYQLLLRDIDAIAVPLRKFADADVPVLWRPLHEAAPGFFWWGAQDGPSYVQLWRLVYDRLVDHHGLHNLIWVWTFEPTSNGTPLDWYPGDDYVDVVSRDVYASDPNTLLGSEWDRLQAEFDGKKLVALSESGTLPDMEASADFGIWWSWFSIWEGSFIRNLNRDRLISVYTSEVVLTRDELPDWRNYTAAEPDPVASRSGLVLYPNPSRGPATLRLTLPDAAEVRGEVFDVMGRRVRTYALGRQPAGVFEATVQLDVAPGVYVVRVVAGAHVASRRLVVGL